MKVVGCVLKTLAVTSLIGFGVSWWLMAQARPVPPREWWDI